MALKSIVVDDAKKGSNMPYIALIFLKIVADPRNVGHLCELVGSMPNIKFYTLGGHVFWNTLASKNGYKLQQNIFTRHCRILDSEDMRIAWGSEAVLIGKMKSVL